MPLLARIAACLFSVAIIGAAQADERFITLSSTTSTQDSGFFDYILPIFKSATGLSVHVIAVGTGHTNSAVAIAGYTISATALPGVCCVVATMKFALETSGLNQDAFDSHR